MARQNLTIIRATKASEIELYAQTLQNSAVLLISEIANFPIDDQTKISKLLVSHGCRYAVCFGVDCSSWDDSIDFAYLEMNGFTANEDNFVMTTWHEDETLEDVFHFFSNYTSFDSFVPDRYIVLLLSRHEKLIKKLETLKENHNFFD